MRIVQASTMSPLCCSAYWLSYVIHSVTWLHCLRPLRWCIEPVGSPVRRRDLLKTCMHAQASCGGTHTMVLTSEGRIYTWGRGSFGRLGTGTEKDYLSPVEVFLPGTYQLLQIGQHMLHDKMRLTFSTSFLLKSTVQVKSDGLCDIYTRVHDREEPANNDMVVVQSDKYSPLASFLQSCQWSKKPPNNTLAKFLLEEVSGVTDVTRRCFRRPGAVARHLLRVGRPPQPRAGAAGQLRLRPHRTHADRRGALMSSTVHALAP